MLKISVSIIVILYSNVFCATAIDWQPTGWAMSCDFNGGDISNVPTAADQCGPTCQNTNGCTHFTWTNFQGGTCWMKSGQVSQSDAVVKTDEGAVCGIVGGSGSALKYGAVLWSDEFNDQNTFNQNWNIQEGNNNGWGNNEAEYYTTNGNIDVSNGFLTITAKNEQFSSFSYTSGRIQTNQHFQYGVFEMRAKLPYGRGTWPAFWMIAATNPLNWPADGEIDILESVGFENSIAHGTIHCNRFDPGAGFSKTTNIGTNSNDNAYNDFHLYQVKWTGSSITMYVDGQLYFTYDKPSSSYNDWPFDNYFKIILNLAVGGNWGGKQGIDNSIFPQKFVIDYVRHYALA